MPKKLFTPYSQILSTNLTDFFSVCDTGLNITRVITFSGRNLIAESKLFFWHTSRTSEFTLIPQ
jgi:hypothetical protein